MAGFAVTTEDRGNQNTVDGQPSLISTSPLAFSLLTGEHPALSDPVQMIGSISLWGYCRLLMQPIHSHQTSPRRNRTVARRVVLPAPKT